jgi:uncharacterized protein (TIGR00251 family)
MPLRVVEEGGESSFWVRVIPRSRRNEITGLHGDALKIRLMARPVDERTNGALIRFLAQCLDVPQSAVAVTGGRASRKKHVHVRGVRPEEVRVLLSP